MQNYAKCNAQREMQSVSERGAGDDIGDAGRRGRRPLPSCHAHTPCPHAMPHAPCPHAMPHTHGRARRPRRAASTGTTSGTTSGTPRVRGPPGTSAPTIMHNAHHAHHVRTHHGTHGRARRPGAPRPRERHRERHRGRHVYAGRRGRRPLPSCTIHTMHTMSARTMHTPCPTHHVHTPCHTPMVGRDVPGAPRAIFPHRNLITPPPRFPAFGCLAGVYSRTGADVVYFAVVDWTATT